MRLHFIDDGVASMPEERTMTRRDSGGNKLVDVHDSNGFCTGVRSNLTITSRVIQPTPVSGGRSASTPDVHFDPQSARYYDLIRSKASDPIGVVVRLCSDGDELLPVQRVRVIIAEPTEDRTAERSSSAPVRDAKSVRSENDAAVRAVLAGMKYTGPITPSIRKAALEMIEIEKNALKPLVRNDEKNPKKGGKSRKPRKSTSKPRAPKGQGHLTQTVAQASSVRV